MRLVKRMSCIVAVVFSISFIGVGCKENKKIEDKTFCEIISEITGKEVNIPSEAPFGVTIGADDSYCEIDTMKIEYLIVLILCYVIHFHMMIFFVYCL